ncbi:hypothetical protein RF11_16140 [Thelohanellus kitauei]|uniref:Uncharacterized protein n=1 Tax=Thelohanellus kitauei TaxID=669202 RepID=A0A0C2JMN8_THEKT|nr:hypothetical protein RF11_16140 [Thelohanellus kitauei]
MVCLDFDFMVKGPLRDRVLKLVVELQFFGDPKNSETMTSWSLAKLLSTLSGFYQKDEVEPDQRSMMTKYHYFSKFNSYPFLICKKSFTVIVEDVPEISREKFIELINGDVSKTDFS